MATLGEVLVDVAQAGWLVSDGAQTWDPITLCEEGLSDEEAEREAQATYCDAEVGVIDMWDEDGGMESPPAYRLHKDATRL